MGVWAELRGDKLVYGSLQLDLADGRYFMSPEKKTPRGRPLLITRSALRANRDRLYCIFDSSWGEVGWELTRAKTIGSLRKALEPVRGRPELELLVSETHSPTTWKELREGREDINQLLDRLRIANQKVSDCGRNC
jgi:hypothetical protein